MRFYPSIFEKVKSGRFFGEDKPNGRVTVEPLWELNETNAIYGNSVRGPYRWFQDTADTGVEWEVPNIKNISWDRSDGQDIASCTITLYNTWHEGNLQTPELAGQLGKPGFFWPKRGLEINRWNQVAGKGAFRKDGFWDPNFSWQNVLVPYAMIRCVDVETEILTKRGWLKWDQVKAGDYALGINPQTGFSEWQEIKEVFRSPYKGKLTHLRSRTHDSLTTSNHRWLVYNHNNELEWKTTETLNTNSSIPLSAIHDNPNNEKSYTDDFVELAAWYYTEGSYDRRSGSYCNITQSRTVNMRNVIRIRELLERMFGKPGKLPRGPALDQNSVDIAVGMIAEGRRPVDIVRASGLSDETIRLWRTGIRTPPERSVLWTEKHYDEEKGKSTFIISKSASAQLQEVICGNLKEPNPDFFLALTQDQLDLFIEVCIAGDGSTYHSGGEDYDVFIQDTEERIDAFEMACVLAGRPYHSRKRSGRSVHSISMLKATKTNPLKSVKGINNVSYDDYVWCPRVEHGNWYARRNGCGFFTGNTYEGYNGHSTATEFKSVDDNLNDEHILQTGTWLVESISAGSSGELVLNCKDMGLLLMQQICFPPTVPPALYPLEYYPEGKSAFDSMFGAIPKAGIYVSPGSFGEIRVGYENSSLDEEAGTYNTSIQGHKPAHIKDGNWTTYGLSEAYAGPDDATVWWEFNVEQEVSKLAIKGWAGGYDCWISMSNADDEWLGEVNVPGTGDAVIPAVQHINIPMAIPDNQEPVVNIEIPHRFKDLPAGPVTKTKLFINKIRISFRHLYYSGIADSGGDKYRGGIRDLQLYREGNKVGRYDPDPDTVPWTFAMCAHPTRGYWVIDYTGRMHGFGDAADYDSTAWGVADLESAHEGNQAVAIKAHPSGKGLWVLDRMGNVYAFGLATHYGDHEIAWPGGEIWGDYNTVAVGLAVTYTGEGYWICFSNGTIKGFGDAVTAETPATITIPTTTVTEFMDAATAENFPYTYSVQHKARGIAAHPSKIGVWITSGSGEIFTYGAGMHQYGQLKNRVYNKGMANTFELTSTEFATSLESTKSGNGYWITFGSGHIAAFGDAVKQGPTYVYPSGNANLNVAIDETNMFDWEFYKAIVWSMARDPDGTGFWVLMADGTVVPYTAEFWGNPGYTGLTGYRWHDGNFSGDWKDIVEELLLWSGFTFYDAEIEDDEDPSVFGALESTGIKTDTFVSAEKFDKRPILDIIKELCEVTAYRFRIQEDGSVFYSSPNLWSAGNFDIDGQRIYVEEGTYTRVESDDPDAVPFIPIIDEEIDLFNYDTTLGSESMRSEIIVGTDQPDPKNPKITGFVRHTPRSGNEEVSPGIKILRNIPRVGMWISQLFVNKEEAKLMAELISINAWFAERTSSATIVANPAISLGDQVKFIERNTGEYNIHYISGINSNNDLDSGVWTMNTTSHWLGDQDDWVITANQSDSPGPTQRWLEVSERVDRWQIATNRNLDKGAQANGSVSNIAEFWGEFDGGSISIIDEEPWTFEGTLTLRKRLTSTPITIEALSRPLGTQVFCTIYESTDLVDAIIHQELNSVSETTYLGALGTDGAVSEYVIQLTGLPASAGNGILRFYITIDDDIDLPAADALLVTN